MIEADSAIIKIADKGKEEVDSDDFDFEESEDSEPYQKQNSKMISHQNDRYDTKLIGQGLFNNTEDSVIDSSRNTSGILLKSSHEESSKSLSKNQVEYFSSMVRLGKQIKLPSLKRLKRAESIGLATEEELAKVSKNSKQLLKSPDVKWKITEVRRQEIGDYGIFIKSCIPKFKTLHTIIQRDRTGFKRFFPSFNVSFAGQPGLIMSSKRMCCNATSNFYLTCDENKLSEDDKDFMGYVQSNFSGSTYNIYDNKSEKKLIGTIIYETIFNFTEQPRKIQLYILSPYFSFSQIQGWDGRKSLKELYEINSNGQNKRILKFVNRQPVWNPNRKVFQMNFHGKMKIPSVKNMILVDAETGTKEVMLLTKTDSHTFRMDVDHPLSPRIAMAVACSSFDFKWVCY